MSDAFLALWNHYPSAMTEEYEAWHTFEHVPERLTAPGMRGARRYASFTKDENRYFTLYELEDLRTIEHPAYMDLVRNPTVWSQKMRRHFSNVLRIPGNVLASGGRGIGRCAVVQAYSIGREEVRTSGLRLASELHKLHSRGAVLSFRIGLAEPNQPYEVFAQDDRDDTDTFDLVLVVEGVCREKLERDQSAITTAAEDFLQPRRCLRDGLFELVVAYPDNAFPNDRSQIEISPKLTAQFGI